MRSSLLFGMVFILAGLEVVIAGDDLREEIKSNQSTPRKRFEWFYSKRAYPADTIAHGYLERALKQIESYDALRTTELTWQSIGPQPGTYFSYGNIAGRIPSLVVHPTNSSIVYLGGADGGVWKTTNGGTTWLPKTDFLATLATGSLALDPSNPEIIYWGTGEPYYSGDAYGGAGVFRSTDGGETWASIGLSGEKRIPRIVVDPTNPARIFAATWGGVYRTTNTGGSWTKTLTSGYGYDVVIHPTNPLILYAGIGDNTSSAGIYKSTDNGVTWSKLSSGLPASADVNRLKIEIARSSPSIVYALMSARSPFGGMLGAYKTTDDGTTWTQLTAAPSALFGSNNQGWYDIQLGVSPTDPNLAFVGGLNVYRTTNGGTSWSSVSGSSVHVDQHSIGFGTGVIYLGNDGGVWKSTNDGTSWTNLNATLSITQFYSLGLDKLTPARMYGGTQDNGTQRTTGTPGWTGVLGGDGGMVVVDYSNSNIVYGETQNGSIYKSTNGGTSFSFIYDAAGVWVTPLRLDPVTPTTVYTANQRVFRSTNSGSSWSAISDSLNGGTKVQWLAIHPTTPARIYAASSSKIYKTTNGGTNWTNMTTGLPNLYIEQIVVDPNLPSTVYIVFSGTGASHVYKSTNEGTSWTSINGDLPDIPTNCLVVHPGTSNRLYVGTDVGLFVTTNGGSTWLKETGFPNVAVIDLGITNDSYLVASTHGRGMYKTLIEAASVNLVGPNGGENWVLGQSHTIQWNSANLSGNVKIELSRNGGATFPEVLFASTPNDGSEIWTVTGSITSTARIRVSGVSTPSVADTSDANFSIVQAVISLLNPNTAVSWPVGTGQVLQWSTNFSGGSVKIELSRNGGSSFPEVIFASTPNDGAEAWVVTGPPGTGNRIRISSISNPAIADTSEASFVILGGFKFLSRLYVRDNGGDNDSLEFGIAAGATNGLDPGYGENELPPRPPSGAFDARWVISGSEGSLRDVRDTISSMQPKVTYNGLIQPGHGGFPLVLRWNPAQFGRGTYTLQDPVSSGGLFNINMKTRDSLVLTNPAITSFRIIHTDPETLSVATATGWNMVSLPVFAENRSVAAVYPAATSRAFEFSPNEGYVPRDTLVSGTGYWIKLSTSPSQVIGTPKAEDSISVVPGWNLIGSIGYPVPVGDIIQLPSGIVQSQFIGQAGPVATIQPARSYWVKISQPGRLVLRKPSSPFPEGRSTIPARVRE